MIIIPPHSAGPKKPQTQHDTTVGFLVVFVIVLGIALVFFIAGPRSHNPPPPAAGFVVSGIALVLLATACKDPNSPVTAVDAPIRYHAPAPAANRVMFTRIFVSSKAASLY